MQESSAADIKPWIYQSTSRIWSSEITERLIKIKESKIALKGSTQLLGYMFLTSEEHYIAL